MGNFVERFLGPRVRITRLLIAIMVIILREINILRQEAGLPDRTIEQLKNAVKDEIRS